MVGNTQMRGVDSEAREQVLRLLKIPKIEQKTAEWYEARHNLITASDFAQALGQGKFGTQKQLIEKKVAANTDLKQAKNVFFEWGNMFEPVACGIYSAMHGGITVHEFGLLKHPVYSYFGASPDGITDDGIMLEIKCPFKRKISGDIPLQYYYQIQGQLDVCGLRECDYFECELQRFEDYNEYKEAYAAAGGDGTYTGVILEKDNVPLEYLRLQDHVCDMEDGGTCCKVYYWVLVKYNKVRVSKDDAFVDEKLKALGDVWKKILFYRENPERFQVEVKQSLSLDTESFRKDVLKEKGGPGACLIVDLEDSGKPIAKPSKGVKAACRIVELD